VLSPETVPQRLWIFDFDGTLSPLVPDRRAAALMPEARVLLSELVDMPRQAVAILSSRLLDDLVPRVGVGGVYLGGGSGAEWLLPDGERRTADSKSQRLQGVRNAVMPEVDRLRGIAGVEVEDKQWSVAVHVRQAAPGERARVRAFLEALSRTTGIRFFRGPEVFEIQFLPEIDKLFGTIVLCEMLRHVPSPGTLVYAGDDENDAQVMEWVTRKGGTALFVGGDLLIPGVRVLEDPAALVKEVRRLAGLKATR
jgi:trehalose 6-phosphate phosphatase